MSKIDEIRKYMIETQPKCVEGYTTQDIAKLRVCCKRSLLEMDRVRAELSQCQQMDIANLIGKIRDIDETIALICTNGACYKFAKFLQQLYPECLLYISPNKQHVVVYYNGSFYDIHGERSCLEYTPITPDDESDCENWSFSRLYHAGHVCQECGEHIELKTQDALEENK